MNKFVVSVANVGSEFRSVMRGLARKPGYSIAAWVMLGLAIAANAAVFAIVWGFLLKPLPYVQPQQLSVVRERLPAIGEQRALVSAKAYLTLRRNLEGISSAGLSTWPHGAPATIDGKTLLVGYQRVTPSFFRTLGVHPFLGRWPVKSAGQPGGPPEAVVSWRFWHERLGGQKHILGQLIRVGKHSFRIVGVMPRGFFYEARMGLWLPLVITPSMIRDDSDINYWMTVRRKPGVSQHQLDLELARARASILRGASPGHRVYFKKGGLKVDAQPVHAMFLAQYGVGHLPWLLQAAAGFLLLLAIANVINLGLVRQRSRQHEFALRRVLGSSRGGLVRLILLEHFPIAVGVGITATLLAWAAISALHAFGLPPALSFFQVELAPSVIVFAWVLTIIAILLVMCGPAMIATGRRIFRTIGHGPTATGGKAAHRLQRTLGTVQIALACALLIAGGLLSVSLWNVLAQPLGYSPAHRVSAVVFNQPGDNAFHSWQKLKPKLLAMPRVEAATVRTMLPFSGINHPMETAHLPGQGKDSEGVRINSPSIAPNFFSVMNIPLLAGRPFRASSTPGKVHEAVINASLAKRFFGGIHQAVGQTIDAGKLYRIVGVSRDITWNPIPGNFPQAPSTGLAASRITTSSLSW